MQKALVPLELLSKFAKDLLSQFPKATVVGLAGELGAGKTTLVRSIVEVLSAGKSVPKVVSPTFTLHQSFPSLSRPIEHFDLYRLENADRITLIEIGYYDALTRARAKDGLVFVEWPSQVIEPSLLELDTTIHIEIVPEGRVFRVES